mgnify:CR=1 FL=1
MSDHLNFDTDFLNNAKATSKPKVNSPKQSGGSGGGKDTAKKWAWGIAIVIGIVVLSSLFDDSSSTSSSTYTPPPTTTTNTYASNDDDTVITGTYRCSQYNHNRAGELEPSRSELTTLESQQNGFLTRSAAITREGDRLDNEYVDEYDQDDIDQHNAAIYAYNASLEKYKRDVKANDAAVDSYNARVEVYNNFLIANCTKI